MTDVFSRIPWWSWLVTIIFCGIQIRLFIKTNKALNATKRFFNRRKGTNYKVAIKAIEQEYIDQLELVGEKGSALNNLIEEINYYIKKTKGTTDFSIIQNKVERKLDMKYDNATVSLSFPTYLGLMGTFAGVLLGILTFLGEFDPETGITDDATQNLLAGVLASMATSLVGLILTTINNAFAGETRATIGKDKNDFYDFIQTELMPTLDVSLVSAITKLHETVDKFEPAFDRVITSFQTTFDKCTTAFGTRFEQHVSTVASAVEVMGQNMDKINQNIELQKQLVNTLKSSEITEGLQRYIEASDHFVGITKSLNMFEEARRMMLAAAQEAIAVQNSYNESLKIPREVAVNINMILDRVTQFEQSINNLSPALQNANMLGNDTINAIDNQLRGISRKGKIADRYLDMADGRLEDLFSKQTEAIDEMNRRYRAAIEDHISGFETMLSSQTQELKQRHQQFQNAVEDTFNVEEVHKEFIKLRKLDTLDSINSNVANIAGNPVKPEDLQNEIKDIKSDLQGLKDDIKGELAEIKKETKEDKGFVFGGLFGGKRYKPEDLQNEIKDLKSDLQGLKDDIKGELAEIKKETKEDKSSVFGGLFGGKR